MKHAFGSEILDTAARLIVPYIILFAFYVLFHGHHSPGGGFQAGTIFAAAIVLIRMVRGRRVRWGLNRQQALALACGGVLIYAGIGVACQLFGGNFLDYGALPLALPIPDIRSLGILGIEIGVTITVMGTMILIFDCLSNRQVGEQ
jgi:multicomponent Na+:H+ antiporter subunit B